MTMDEITSIKKQTRLALPKDDSYLYRLGIALYGFASITSFMVEVIFHIDETQKQSSILEKTSGHALGIFEETLKKIKAESKYTEIYNVMEKTANLFAKLNKQRTDFVHSCPITNKEKKQILYRRKDKEQKYFEVDNAFLDQFISELHDVSSGLYEIRKVVRPDLDR